MFHYDLMMSMVRPKGGKWSGLGHGKLAIYSTNGTSGSRGDLKCTPVCLTLVLWRSTYVSTWPNGALFIWWGTHGSIGSRVQTRESTYGGARSGGLTFEKGLTLLGKGPRAMHITQRLEAVVQMINNRNLQWCSICLDRHLSVILYTPPCFRPYLIRCPIFLMCSIHPNNHAANGGH